VLANVPAGDRVLLRARSRGCAVLPPRGRLQPAALARGARTDGLMRSFVRWNQAVAELMGGSSGRERGLPRCSRAEGGPRSPSRAFSHAVCYERARAAVQGQPDAALATAGKRWPRGRGDKPGGPHGPAHGGPGPVFVRGEPNWTRLTTPRGVTLAGSLPHPRWPRLGLAARFIARAWGRGRGPAGRAGGQAGLAAVIAPVQPGAVAAGARLLLASG